MKFCYTDLETCHEARGMVVVIDVIRAFTNAAFAFSRGAKEIHPVSTVEEALQFKATSPEVLACAEYLEELLKGNRPDPGPFLERVRKSRESMQMFFDLKEPLFPKSDLDLCAALNVFDFAMPVTRQNGHFTMRAIKP